MSKEDRLVSIATKWCLDASTQWKQSWKQVHDNEVQVTPGQGVNDEYRTSDMLAKQESKCANIEIEESIWCSLVKKLSTDVEINANGDVHLRSLNEEDIMKFFPADWPPEYLEALRRGASHITKPATPTLEQWPALTTKKPAKAKATTLRANGWAEQIDTD